MSGVGNGLSVVMFRVWLAGGRGSVFGTLVVLCLSRGLRRYDFFCQLLGRRSDEISKAVIRKFESHQY